MHSKFYKPTKKIALTNQVRALLQPSVMEELGERQDNRRNKNAVIHYLSFIIYYSLFIIIETR